MSIEREAPTAETGDPSMRCIVPGCAVTSSVVGGNTCVIWGGRRLCYPHFSDFAAHPLSATCSDRGAGPFEPEWTDFIRHLLAAA